MSKPRVDSESGSFTNWQVWGLRPIVLFVATYTIVGILHEVSHAVTAYSLGVPSTLFHVGVNPDYTHGTVYQHAVIGLAGPLFALGVGLISLGAYLKVRD